MKNGVKIRLVAVLVVFAIVFCGFQLMRTSVQTQEKQARAFVHQLAKNAFPSAARQTRDLYGLIPLRSDPKSGEQSGSVVLIHGLDEPGKIWMNLGPALVEKGFRVFDMLYPNDQAISLSSEFFFEELMNLADQGEISVIAHSMGGLVTRDMLTRTDLNYDLLAGRGRLPRIRRLIMVGTPNHGSQLARFRIITEIRDQVYHWLNKDSHALHFLLDGTGAAAVDLIPGSDFLESLNSRPHPGNLDMHIIAAKILPWEGKIFDILGDILVTVDSTKLQGVSHTLVRGSHITMIRNLIRSSTRVPPAVPKIIKMLSEK